MLATGKAAQSPLGSVDVLDAHTSVLSSQFQSSSSELSFKGNHCCVAYSLVLLLLTIPQRIASNV